jgi:hypothetical protein
MTAQVERISPPREARPGEMKLGFGARAEWPISVLPTRYACWLLSTAWFRRDHPRLYALIRNHAIGALIEQEAHENS